METVSFFAVDIFIVFVIAFSFIIGWARGATKEILSVVSWVGGIYFSISLFPYTKEIARKYISHGLIADFATICILFIIFLTTLSVLNYFCTNFIKKSVLNRTDKALGGVFGIIRGVVILAVLDIFSSQCVFTESPKWIENSKLRPYINSVSNFGILMLPESIQDKVLSHLTLVKKQNLLDFVKDDIVKNVPDVAGMENKMLKDKFSSSEVENENIVDSDDISVIEEKLEKEEAKKIAANKQDDSIKKEQTAESLASLKPKKKTGDTTTTSKNTQSNSKENKKERFDMDRVLDQYETKEEE